MSGKSVFEADAELALGTPSHLSGKLSELAMHERNMLARLQAFVCPEMVSVTGNII